MRAYALPLSLGSLFPCVHLILWWQSWLSAFLQPAKVKCLFLNCPSKNLRTDFYWTNMGCVLTSQPGTVAVGMESFIWWATLKSEAYLGSQNWKELAREVGRELFPKRKSGCFHQKEENLLWQATKWGGDIPSPPPAPHPLPRPPRPAPGRESALVWIDTSDALPSRSQHFPLPPFVGSLLAAPESPGASVLCMWPLKPLSSDLTHILVALVENTDYLECNLLIYMKRELNLWPSNLTAGKPVLSRNKTTPGKIVCSWIFIATLSVMVK